MSAQLSVTPGESFPAGQPVDLAALRRAAKPTVNPAESTDVSSIPDNSLTTAKWANNDFDFSTKGKDNSVTNAKLKSGAGSGTANAAVSAAKVNADAYLYADATLATNVYGFALSPVGCNPAAYAKGQRFYFKADAANPTGGTQVNVNSIAAKDLKKRTATGLAALAAGDIQAGQMVEIIYDGTQFVLLSPVANAGTGTPVVSSVRNLVLKSTSVTTVNFSADEVVLKNSDGAAVVVTPSNIDVVITASGAGGLDAGAEGASTWYYIYCIYNGTTVSGLLSASATAPTLPTGYTYKALIGAVRNDGSSNFVTFHQFDRKVWLNLTNLFTAKACGVANTYEVLGGTDATNFAGLVPPIAKTAIGVAGSSHATNAAFIAIAGDTTGLGATTICVPVTASTQDGFSASAGFEVPLKTSQNFAWKAPAAATSRISISGYTI